MDNIFKLSILTPNSNFFKGNVINLKATDFKGNFEILPNHMAMITLIKQCAAEFDSEDGRKYTADLSDGVMKIQDNKVTLLCYEAKWPEGSDKR